MASNAGPLPPSFDLFVQRTCDGCGDQVPLRYVDDGRCVGCREGGDD